MARAEEARRRRAGAMASPSLVGQRRSSAVWMLSLRRQASVGEAAPRARPGSTAGAEAWGRGRLGRGRLRWGVSVGEGPGEPRKVPRHLAARDPGSAGWWKLLGVFHGVLRGRCSGIQEMEKG